MRWNSIRGHVSKHCAEKYKSHQSKAQKLTNLLAPWFLEHQIHNERDFEHHYDYIHWNSVKHIGGTCLRLAAF